MSQKWKFFVVSVALSSLLVAAASAAPLPGRARPEKPGERARPEVAKPAKSLENQSALARATGNLGLSRAEAASALREWKNEPTEYEALKRMMRESADAPGAENTRVLSGYLKLMTRSVGEFHLRPLELEGRLTTWSPTAKQNLALVLESAARAAEGNAVTREMAFAEGLKKEKRLQKFKEYCKK